MDDFGLRILEDYPLPIARAYRRLLSAGDEAERFDRALQLGEICLKYAALVGLASYLADSDRHPALDRALTHLTRPSLGHWRLFLELLTKLCDDRPWLVPPEFARNLDRREMAGAVSAMRRCTGRDDLASTRVSCRRLLVELVEFRNWLAHTAPPPERRQLAAPLTAGFLGLLQEWKYLAEAELVLSSGKSRGATAVGQAIRYMGEVPLVTEVRHACGSCTGLAEEPRLCIVMNPETEHCFPVHPLLVHHPSATEPLFVHGRHNQTWSLLDHSTGRSVRVPQLDGDFHKLLGERLDLGASMPRHNLLLGPNPHFVDRKQELQCLDRWLQADGAVVILAGMGGIGKTQVAVQYAWQAASRYPGGIFWLNGESRKRLEREYASLSEYFAIPGDLPQHERLGLVVSALSQSQRPTLLVLDNVATAAEVIVPTCPRVRVLITTRRRHLDLPGAREYVLAPLEQEAAVRLVCSHLDRVSAADRQAATELCDLLGHVPLALSLAAHHVRRLNVPVSAYVDSLQTRNGLELLEQAGRGLRSPTDHDASLLNTFLLSYESLSDGARRLLHQAACFHPRDIPLDVLSSATGWTRLEFSDRLEELVGACLAERAGEDRISVHGLVHQYARELCTENEYGEYLIRSAESLVTRLEHDIRRQDWHVAREELPHVSALARQVGRLPPTQVQFRLWRCLGRCLSEERELSPARRWLARALRRAVQVHGSNHPVVADCRSELGMVLYRAGRREEGERLCRQALEVQRSRSAMDPMAVRDGLTRLGEIVAVRDPGAAVPLFEEALTLSRQHTGESSAETAESWNNLGYAHKMNHDLERGLKCYRRALAIGTRVHGRVHPTCATRLNNLGMLLLEKGDYEAAEKHLREALQIDESLLGRGHARVSVRLVNLARVCVAKGKPSEAEKYLREALARDVARYGRQHPDIGLIHRGFGDVFTAMGRPNQARRHYDKALRIFELTFGPDHPYTVNVRRRRESLQRGGD